MIDQGVTAALAARDANRNGDDSHTSGTGGRRTERVARECTYQDFMKCKPLYFKGTKGVVELTQWFERMETVFRISNCSVENQIKFSTCTLLAGALTWWNSHVMTVSHDVAYAMTWADLRKKMTDKYCPRNEMKKLEAELWNLKVKGTDVIGYNQRFQELALLCVRMFPEESDKIERYVGGLPDMIHGNIVASKPKTMQEAVEMATVLMDKKVSTIITPCECHNEGLLDGAFRRVVGFTIKCPKLLEHIGSPRADDHELLELPYMPEDPYVEAALQAPPSPDYVPGPEEPEHAPPLPDYVPGAEHADDEIVAEDQPYAEDASPIAQSSDYVPESDPEADPEEDDYEDPEEDPIDYPADRGDDGDDEMDIEEDEDADMDIDADEEDEDDEMDVEIDEEVEEEHSAPAYPVVVALPATVPSAEETEPFETDESAATPPPHPAYRMTTRITIPEPLHVPTWSNSEVARLFAISSPPASPLSPWSSSPPQIPFPLSPPSPILTAPPLSPIRSLGY
ncbi:reverse transcriptase domain-containing protein [Tanacetum coccineum]